MAATLTIPPAASVPFIRGGAPVSRSLAEQADLPVPAVTVSTPSAGAAAPALARTTAPAAELGASAATAPPATAKVTSGPVLQRLRTVLTTAVDQAANWVSGLPAGPVKDFLAGALLLASRSLNPAYKLPTTLTIRNETNQSGTPGQVIQIWAYDAGTQGEPWDRGLRYQETLQPGQEWRKTASNSEWDHAVVIKDVTDQNPPQGTSLLFFRVANPLITFPKIEILWRDGDLVPQSHYFRQQEQWVAAYGGQKVALVYRGADGGSSGKNMVVSIWNMPTQPIWNLST